MIRSDPVKLDSKQAETCLQINSLNIPDIDKMDTMQFVGSL